MTVFSQNLKRFRISKNMTQEQAAEALGVSTQTVSRWECNTTLPDVTILPKIAALYCVTIDDLYKEMGISTPGQKHFGENIVTCIKGHPCVIFWNPGYEEIRDSEGNIVSSRVLEDIPSNYQYIGKYNLNLDKATPEPFGFDYDDSDFGYLSPGDEYYQVLYYDEDKPDEPTWIGQLDPTEGGDYYPG